MIKAILFDLNGTMIDDMGYHTNAWFHIINNELKKEMSYEDVKKEMYGKNQEVLVRVFGAGRFTPDEMIELSFKKEKKYQEEFFPQLKLIKGLNEFLEKAHSNNIKMAIASAAIPFNIDFVLDNLNIRHYFSAIVSADDVTTSKPHPETFLKAAEILNVAPEDCVVFEDAPKGVEAAENAGMQAAVLTTMHGEEEFEKYKNIKVFAKDYTHSYFSGLF